MFLFTQCLHLNSTIDMCLGYTCLFVMAQSCFTDQVNIVWIQRLICLTCTTTTRAVSGSSNWDRPAEGSRLTHTPLDDRRPLTPEGNWSVCEWIKRWCFFRREMEVWTPRSRRSSEMVMCSWTSALILTLVCVCVLYWCKAESSRFGLFIKCQCTSVFVDVMNECVMPRSIKH